MCVLRDICVCFELGQDRECHFSRYFDNAGITSITETALRSFNQLEARTCSVSFTEARIDDMSSTGAIYRFSHECISRAGYAALRSFRGSSSGVSSSRLTCISEKQSNAAPLKRCVDIRGSGAKVAHIIFSCFARASNLHARFVETFT